MKEFEKYAKGNCKIKVDCGNISCGCCLNVIQATAWKAALEWVLKEGDKHANSDGSLIIDIEQELET